MTPSTQVWPNSDDPRCCSSIPTVTAPGRWIRSWKSWSRTRQLAPRDKLDFAKKTYRIWRNLAIRMVANWWIKTEQESTGNCKKAHKKSTNRTVPNSSKMLEELFAMFSPVALIWDLYGKLPAAFKFHVLFCSIPSLHDDLPFTMILILFDIYLSLYWYSYYPHDSLNDIDNRSVL